MMSEFEGSNGAAAYCKFMPRRLSICFPYVLRKQIIYAIQMMCMTLHYKYYIELGNFSEYILSQQDIILYPKD